MKNNKGIILVLFIFLEACSAEIDQKKFEKVYRAAKTIQSATELGLNYQKFGELLQDFSTELSIADDIAKSDLEKTLVERYKKGFSAYQDSNLIWSHKINSANYAFVPAGEIFVDTEMQSVVEKYNLKVQIYTESLYKNPPKRISDSSIQEIWQVAKAQIDDANNIYNGVHREP